jgi:hypothetical protein
MPAAISPTTIAARIQSTTGDDLRPTVGDCEADINGRDGGQVPTRRPSRCPATRRPAELPPMANTHLSHAAARCSPRCSPPAAASTSPTGGNSGCVSGRPWTEAAEAAAVRPRRIPVTRLSRLSRGSLASCRVWPATRSGRQASCCDPVGRQLLDELVGHRRAELADLAAVIDGLSEQTRRTCKETANRSSSSPRRAQA